MLLSDNSVPFMSLLRFCGKLSRQNNMKISTEGNGKSGILSKESVKGK